MILWASEILHQFGMVFQPKQNRFITPMNIIDISPINHSYWSYNPSKIMGCLPPFSTGDERISLAHPPYYPLVMTSSLRTWKITTFHNHRQIKENLLFFRGYRLC